MAAGLDPRLPVLVGAGQITQRVRDGDPTLEPAELMAEALRRAEDDSGASGVLAAADSIQVVGEVSAMYPDPGALVAERIGATPRETVKAVMGGSWMGWMLNHAAADIQAGRADVVLLTGGEAWVSAVQARRQGRQLGWATQPDGTEPTRIVGDEAPLLSSTENARGLLMPVQVYPLFEIAVRATEGEAPEAHRRRIGELYERFAAVASENPYAWRRTPYTAEEIITPSPSNRWIGYPYTKLLVSNQNVDQGAGLILCSVAKAEALGIPRDGWIFLHGAADAHDHWYVSNRSDLHSSPAMRVAGRAALDLAGLGVDELAHVDLYSCFPAAVQIGATELGLGLDRQLTVTGGMAFAGGPWNNYTMHGIATMAGVLRDDPGSYGLCSANGGFITEHSFCVYSTEPPRAGAFRHAEPQDEVDALPRRDLVDDHDGPVEVESYTVMFDRDGNPTNGIVAGLTPGGQRTWCGTEDADAMAELMADECVGRKATRNADGRVELA